MRLSSFESAVDTGRRAFIGAQQIDGMPIDSVAYSFGYLSVEAAHNAPDDARRTIYLRDAIDAERWLRHHGAADLSTHMLAGGLRAEIAIAQGTSVQQAGLDAAAALYPDAAPDLIAWHHLVISPVPTPTRSTSHGWCAAGRSARSVGAQRRSPAERNSNRQHLRCAPRPSS